MNIHEMASAIRNNVSNGLKGVSNISYSIEQIIDEIYLTRNSLIKEYALKRVLSLEQMGNELEFALEFDASRQARKAEIPRISRSIPCSVQYAGTSDRQCPYIVYTDHSYIYHKYNRIIKNKPYVWIDMSLNCNGKLDMWLFNQPLMSKLTLVAVWEDLREVCEGCGQEVNIPDFMKNDIVDRITKKYVAYYRQLNQPIIQNNTQVSTT